MNPSNYTLQNLKDKLNSYYILTDEFIDFLDTYAKIIPYKKNESLIDIGTPSRYYYFVLEGILSYYYLTEEGDKIIKRFFLENTFAGSLSSCITNKDSIFGLEALEDSIVIRFPHNEFRRLLSKDLGVALVYIGYLEKQWVIEIEQEEVFLKAKDASQRYKDFVEKYSSILGRLKQHHIASYIGVTPTQLSRITKKE